MPQWDPKQYLAFAQERTQPSIDLVGRIEVAEVRRILDVGCGPGNSTEVLARKYPGAEVVGLDNSPEMIEQARRDYPAWEWRLGDAAQFDARDRYDIVFSNAVLQWIPRHEELLPRLMRGVRGGGVLAFQVPGNNISAFHQSLLRAAARPEWAQFVAGCERLLTYKDLRCYYDVLTPHAANIELWETTYYHRLASHQALIGWYKSTGMKPFLEKLPDEGARERFQAEVLEGCRGDYPVQEDGNVLFPFRRLFCIARR